MSQKQDLNFSVAHQAFDRDLLLAVVETIIPRSEPERAMPAASDLTEGLQNSWLGYYHLIEMGAEIGTCNKKGVYFVSKYATCNDTKMLFFISITFRLRVLTFASNFPQEMITNILVTFLSRDIFTYFRIPVLPNSFYFVLN